MRVQGAELAKGTRTYVPAGSVVRSVTIAKDVATVDLGETFLKGTDTGSTLARLDQWSIASHPSPVALAGHASVPRC